MDKHSLQSFRATPGITERKGWAAGDPCMRAFHLVMLTCALKPITPEQRSFYCTLFQDKGFDLPIPYGELIAYKTIIKLIACEGHGLTAAEAAFY